MEKEVNSKNNDLVINLYPDKQPRNEYKFAKESVKRIIKS
jgi:hypothetical protein